MNAYLLVFQLVSVNLVNHTQVYPLHLLPCKI